MQEDIRDIQFRMQTGRFPNEASISQGIVMRLLSRLGWPVYDTSVVIPEFALEGRRVDFALCHPANKPIVFIEVKQPGETGTAERQLFEYAFHMGVPMVVLTTGQEWHFYLPAERGDYGERRVYGLDLVQRDVHESESVLRRYLEYSEVCSGAAIDNAKHDYQDVARSREVRRAIPDAWRSLFDEPDELLVELLADKTETICGFRPEIGAVVDFLRRLPETIPDSATDLRQPVSEVARIPTSLPRSVESRNLPSKQALFRPSIRSQKSTSTSIKAVELFGQRHDTNSNRDALHLVLQSLQHRDPTFLDRFVAHQGQGRRWVARDPRMIHPNRTNLSGFAREIAPGMGWWMNINLDTNDTVRFIKIACEVAMIIYGTDLKLDVRSA